MSTIHLIIQGKVQGVFYRASARKMAEQLDIKGWVRNVPGGQVEIMAQGSDEMVQKFMDWCRKGPSGARVDNVTLKPVEDQHFPDFSILR